MANIISRFASSFAALLNDSTILDIDGRVEYIRDAMLEVLAPHVNCDAPMPPVWFGITRAYDIQTLWYLRSDLLSVLAMLSGENNAHRTLSSITEMFRGTVPDALMPKSHKFNK